MKNSRLKMPDGRAPTVGVSAWDIEPGEVVRLANGSRPMMVLDSRTMPVDNQHLRFGVYLHNGEVRAFCRADRLVRELFELRPVREDEE